MYNFLINVTKLNPTIEFYETRVYNKHTTKSLLSEVCRRLGFLPFRRSNTLRFPGWDYDCKRIAIPEKLAFLSECRRCKTSESISQAKGRFFYFCKQAAALQIFVVGDAPQRCVFFFFPFVRASCGMITQEVTDDGLSRHAHKHQQRNQ